MDTGTYDDKNVTGYGTGATCDLAFGQFFFQPLD
jgi:hypothetical protein